MLFTKLQNQIDSLSKLQVYLQASFSIEEAIEYLANDQSKSVSKIGRCLQESFSSGRNYEEQGLSDAITPFAAGCLHIGGIKGKELEALGFSKKVLSRQKELIDKISESAMYNYSVMFLGLSIGVFLAPILGSVIGDASIQNSFPNWIIPIAIIILFTGFFLAIGAIRVLKRKSVSFDRRIYMFRNGRYAVYSKYRFFKLFSFAVNSDISVPEALTIAGHYCESPWLKDLCKDAIDLYREGGDIGEFFDENKVFGKQIGKEIDNALVRSVLKAEIEKWSLFWFANSVTLNRDISLWAKYVGVALCSILILLLFKGVYLDLITKLIN